MAFKTAFITGANRGLGLEFVQQILSLRKPPTHLFAACRDPTNAKVCISTGQLKLRSVADPGFPVGGGGRRPVGGCQPPTHTLFGKTYVKTKEMDPVGGAPAAPPGSANGGDVISVNEADFHKFLTIIGFCSAYF